MILLPDFMLTLPALPFGYADLAPFIDEETVHVHYDKHHQTYLTKLLAALEGSPAADWPLEEILRQANSLPTAIKNNGGGVWNHSFYWACLAKGKNTPSPRMQEIIAASFGSWEQFVESFTQAGMNVFGSGWVWLEKKPDGTLVISTSANQDNPLNTNPEAHLLLTCDVWEHAYYLQYRNLRVDYLKNFWQVVNWEAVESFYDTPYTFGA